MAQNDLNLVVGAEVNKNDLKGVIKSVEDVAAEVEKIFTRTTSSITKKLASKEGNPLGVGAIHQKFLADMKELEQNWWPYVKGSRKNLARYFAKKYGHDLGDLDALNKFLGQLGPFDTLFPEVKTLQTQTASNSIAPETGLGRYGVLGRYLDRFRSIMYAWSFRLPGVVTKDTLEAAEYFKGINLKSGSQNRSALRYIQDKKYRESALAQARDYLMLTGDTDILRQLSAAYGLDFKASTDQIPKRVNAQALNDLITWSQYGLSAQAHKQALLGGGLSKEEKAYHTVGYREDMRQFIRLQQKLFPQEKEIATNLKKLNQSDIIRFGGKGGDGWLKTLIGSGVGLAGMNRLASAAGSMLESYWGESIQRNVYASQQAYYKRWEIGSKVAGSAAGGIIGAIIGGLIAGPAGSMVGAGVGGGIGSSAGLYGTYMGTKYQGDIKSSNDMMARVRAKTLFGAGYNPYFAQQITDFGIANGEAALQQMSHSAQTFRARVMTGQVGEQEWFYLSMMPNYYAALMSGVSGQELANIYAKDLNAIGDKSMRYMVGESLGGTEALAMATNPYFGKTYGKMAALATEYDTKLQPFVAGYVGTRAEVANENVRKNFAEIVNTAFRADPTIFNEQHLSALRQLGIIEPSNVWQEKQKAEEFLGLRDIGKKITLVNVINVDGEEVKRETKTADQMYEESLQSFYVGGN